MESVDSELRILLVFQFHNKGTIAFLDPVYFSLGHDLFTCTISLAFSSSLSLYFSLGSSLSFCSFLILSLYFSPFLVDLSHSPSLSLSPGHAVIVLTDTDRSRHLVSSYFPVTVCPEVPDSVRVRVSLC